MSLFLYLCDMQKLPRISLLLLLTLTVISNVCAQKQSVSFQVGTKYSATNFIPTDEGCPELKTDARYIAIPKDSDFNITIDSISLKTTRDIYIYPASRLPSDYDSIDYHPVENKTIYSKDEFFPSEIINWKRMSFRDFDIILVGIALEQYNPVHCQLKSIENAIITCHFDQPKDFENPNDNSLFKNIVINPDFFDEYIDEESPIVSRRDGCDYLIITPNDMQIKAWADTLKNFRETQGIMTKVVTLEKVGVNNPDTLKSYLKNAYENWSPAPSAVLLLGDYNSNPTKGITTYALKDHPEGQQFEPYLTDNKLVDFNNDNLPDIVIARMPAANHDEARLMVQKTIQYELHPYTDASYYDKVITAMGYQRKRWFQLCTEVVAGYFHKIGKQDIHLNAIYQGAPDSVWSTGQKTENVINYFGPNGLDYIPPTMSHLTEWDANDDDITQAIQDGTFMLLHRDHGTYESWGEPAYNTTLINNLNNDKLTFVMSANCQTGHFGYGNKTDCFAERFLRIPQGAVGVIAASELSYSYVNDTYVWGFFDYLYPYFMPDYGSYDMRFQYPAFANAYGKYFLHQSSFPSNASMKAITYHLFHYFGDAYLQLYTEVPQTLSVEHPEYIRTDIMDVTIYADDDATIALSTDNHLISKNISKNGSATLHFLNVYDEGDTLKVVVTKQNHYRHESNIIISNTFGVGEQYHDEQIKIYPNPTSGIIHIEGENISSIKVFNMLGQEVISVSDYHDNTPVEIDCSSLNHGVYHVVVSLDDKHVIHRSIVLTDHFSW